jgi:hypothetical protein
MIYKIGRIIIILKIIQNQSSDKKGGLRGKPAMTVETEAQILEIFSPKNAKKIISPLPYAHAVFD